jgi:hypothetical protein
MSEREQTKEMSQRQKGQLISVISENKVQLLE